MANKTPLAYELIPAKNQPAKSLVVIFHGHGGNAAEFVDVAEDMGKTMPDTDFICIDGPEHIAGEPASVHTWLKLNSARSLPKIALQLAFNRIPIIDRINLLIDEELKKRNLTNDKLGLMGFSLGGGIALTVGMSRKEKCAGVVSHSGVYYRYPHVKSRPDALMLMGDFDYLYPKEEAKGLTGAFKRAFSFQHDRSVARLRKSGVSFEEVIIPGLDHSVNDESVGKSAAFLKKKLG